MKKPELKSFVTGESVKWKKEIPGYSAADGWQLVYSFRSKKSQFDINCIAEGNLYVAELSANDSLRLETGRYKWQASLLNGDDYKIIDSGYTQVETNLALLDNFDSRSHVEKVLDALEACLLGKASRDQMSYSIAGRSLSRFSPHELLEWRDKYKAEHIRTQRKAGDRNDQLIKVRFSS